MGDDARELDRPPFGTNMAFRKQMFEKYGGFRTDLGRCGESLIGNEDTEFCQRLMAAGERLWYAPSAVVCHPVTEHRLTKSYLRAWWYCYGRASIRQARKQLPAREIPRIYWRRLRDLLREMFLVNPDWPLYPDWRFHIEIEVCIAAGEIAELLGLGRGRTWETNPSRSGSAGEEYIASESRSS